MLSGLTHGFTLVETVESWDSTDCKERAIVPRSSVSSLLEFSAMLRVTLVSPLTAGSLHDNMLGCLSPPGEWS